MPTGIYKRKPMPLEVRLKISKSHIGMKYSKAFCQDRSIVAKSRTGNKNSNWKGGICLNKEYLSWIKNKRNRVLKRVREEKGTHTFEQWVDIKYKNNFSCAICKRKEPEIKLTEDHIIPLSKGGSDLIENIQPLCQSCNSTKSNNIQKCEIKTKKKVAAQAKSKS